MCFGSLGHRGVIEPSGEGSRSRPPVGYTEIVPTDVFGDGKGPGPYRPPRHIRVPGLVHLEKRRLNQLFGAARIAAQVGQEVENLVGEGRVELFECPHAPSLVADHHGAEVWTTADGINPVGLNEGAVRDVGPNRTPNRGQRHRAVADADEAEREAPRDPQPDPQEGRYARRPWTTPIRRTTTASTRRT